MMLLLVDLIKVIETTFEEQQECENEEQDPTLFTAETINRYLEMNGLTLLWQMFSFFTP